MTAPWLLLIPNAIVILCFLTGVASLVAASFSGHGAVYAAILASPVTRDIVLRTVVNALATTAICVILSFPVALFIARSRAQGLWLMLVISPWLTSVVVRTFGWVVILGNRGLLNHVLVSIGLTDAPIRMLFTRAATIAGLVHIMAPLMILSLLAVIQSIDRAVMEAATSLGANPLQRFLRATLPLSLPGLLSGCSLVYLLATGAIVTPLLLGGLRDKMLGTQIYQEIFGTFDFPRAAALATILLAVSLTLVLPIQWAEARLRRRNRA